MEASLSVKITLSHLQNKANEIVDYAISHVMPTALLGDPARAANSLTEKYMLSNIISLEDQISSQLIGGDDLVWLLHPRGPCNGGGRFQPDDVMPICEALSKARAFPEFLTQLPAFVNTLAELSFKAHMMCLKGVSKETLKDSVSNVHAYCKDLNDALKAENAVLPSDAYEHLTNLICSNLIGTLKSNIALYHSGLNFYAALVSLVEALECNDIEQIKTKLKYPVAYGRQFCMAIDTNNV